MWYNIITFLLLLIYPGFGLCAENKYDAATCVTKLKDLTIAYLSNQGDQASVAKDIVVLMKQCPYPCEHLAGYASALTITHCFEQAEQCKKLVIDRDVKII
jgi:hypothetical protein